MNAMKQTSAGAVWSLVLGILSMVCLGPLAAIPAIICGHTSRTKIRASGGRLTGDGMALAGLILGYVSLTVVAVILSVYFGLVAVGRSTQQKLDAVEKELRHQ